MQYKREAIGLDFAQRATKNQWKFKWAVLTEQDTWWSPERFLEYLAEVERVHDVAQSKNIPPILVGAGATNQILPGHEWVYGPFIVLSSALFYPLYGDRGIGPFGVRRCQQLFVEKCLKHDNKDMSRSVDAGWGPDVYRVTRLQVESIVRCAVA